MKTPNWKDYEDDIRWFVEHNNNHLMSIVLLEKDRLILFDKLRKENHDIKDLLQLLNFAHTNGWMQGYKKR